MKKRQIINKVAKQTEWWIFQRRKKLEGLSHKSMTVNPFLLPFVFEFHTLNNFDGLANFLLGGHFWIGHTTGFGKLIDEKILPNVFGARKLDTAFRKNNPPFNLHVFDEIDHLIPTTRDSQNLLSLKSSRWTIQLTMAVQLNAVFCKLIKMRSEKRVKFEKIVVGVIYGKESRLTDKYDILRGINRGKKHNVVDITKYVEVKAGKNFWAWLNNGEQSTDQWVLKGIMEGLVRADKRLTTSGKKSFKKLVTDYRREFVKRYEKYIDKKGRIDWEKILASYDG